MFVIDVVPISRGIAKETLSYFTGTAVAPGSMVTVPLRSGTVPGLVVAASPASDRKSELRASPFMMKKVQRLGEQALFSEVFLLALRETADMFAATEGAVLSFAVSKAILDAATELPGPDANGTSPQRKGKRHAIEADQDTRIRRYTQTIATALQNETSVIICTPSRHAAEHLANNLEYEGTPILFHGSMSKTKVRAAWERAAKEPGPQLIIGTGQVLSFPRNDIGLVIIEEEGGSGWKALRRPFGNFRILAEALAKRAGADLIIGDTLLRIETRQQLEAGTLETVQDTSSKPRQKHHGSETLSPFALLPETASANSSTPSTALADLRGTAFAVLGEAAIQALRTTAENGNTSLVFSARKGIAPVTVCSDCGETVTCAACETPLALRKKAPANVFVCHFCKTERSAAELCKNCGSWKLTALGIGIDRVEEAVRQAFSKIPVVRIDSDTTRTETSIIQSLKDAGRSIIVATELVLPYIDTVETTVVASVDSLLSIPDFHANERVFRMLAELRAKTTESCIIQTRKPDHPTLLAAAKKDVQAFYDAELSDRKRFKLPPFSTIIKASIAGPQERAKRDMAKAMEMLAAYAPVLVPAFKARGNGIRISAIIKTSKETWPDRNLLALLKSLPPAFEIDVDPESML
jgi:primosomal protein N'